MRNPRAGAMLRIIICGRPISSANARGGKTTRPDVEELAWVLFGVVVLCDRIQAPGFVSRSRKGINDDGVEEPQLHVFKGADCPLGKVDCAALVSSRDAILSCDERIGTVRVVGLCWWDFHGDLSTATPATESRCRRDGRT